MMDTLSLSVGLLLLALGIAALAVTWFRPALAQAPVIRGVLMPARLPATKGIRSLAALMPMVLGVFFLVSGTTLSGPRWPSFAVLGAYLAIAIAVHLERSDG